MPINKDSLSGIYIHIPYCRKACHYCDFHFSTNLSTKGNLIGALIQELHLRSDYLQNESIETIYFGGGTPSLLSSKDLSGILDAIKQSYIISDHSEITLESNPEDLTVEKLNLFKALGVNRLSIGIQSFNDQHLELFNRNHNTKTSLQAVRNAREVGFQNISLDLIFGIPDQSVDMLEDDLRQVIKLDPEHISLYGLTIEQGTVFGNWDKKGQLKKIDEDIAATQFEVIMRTLKSKGYAQYEVSNFCKPGYKSRHNSAYWEQKHYLGVGPGAHSFNGNTREYNVKNNHKYINSISSGHLPSELEHLTAEDKLNEAILISIRTAQGINLQELNTNFEFDLLVRKKDYIKEMINSGLVNIENDHLMLTPEGILLADEITQNLIP